jgi:S-(hydroxymethyl)glutathione dehydrogenase/alcohol dehydrogenase
MRAQAVVVRSVADGPRLEEIEVDPPGPGEVLVRVAASGICGSDLHILHGRSVIDSFPMVLGHEGAGVVEEVGDGVTSVAAGDHVVLALYGPCGTCDQCRTGRFVLCDGTARVAAIGGRMADGSTRMRLADGSTLFPMVGIGSLAEWAVLRADQVVAVDPAIPLDVICLAGCGVTTGLGSVFNVADVRPGESVAVVGCGGVGLNVVQGARIAGASPIVAVDTNPRKLDLARRLGATHAVEPGEGGGVAAAVQRVVPRGVDVAFEVVGVPALVAEAFLATRAGGRCVMVGSPPAGEPIPVDGRALFGERRLLGTTGGSNVPARDIPRIARLYSEGRLDLDTLVSARRPLGDFASSIGETERGEVARSVVVMG